MAEGGHIQKAALKTMFCFAVLFSSAETVEILGTKMLFGLTSLTIKRHSSDSINILLMFGVP